MQKYANIVDLVKSFQTSTSIYYLVFTIYTYLLAKIGFDTAENGPLKVCQKSGKNFKVREQINVRKNIEMHDSRVKNEDVLR